jgi:hypothetical protein
MAETEKSVKPDQWISAMVTPGPGDFDKVYVKIGIHDFPWIPGLNLEIVYQPKNARALAQRLRSLAYWVEKTAGVNEL